MHNDEKLKIYLIFCKKNCIIIQNHIFAGVMELADVPDSKSGGSDTVPVRPRSPAPQNSRMYVIREFFLFRYQRKIVIFSMIRLFREDFDIRSDIRIQPNSPLFYDMVVMNIVPKFMQTKRKGDHEGHLY